MVCRAKGSPSCAAFPGASGRPGNRGADGTLSRAPGLLLIRRPPPRRQAATASTRAASLAHPADPIPFERGGEAGFRTRPAKPGPRLPVSKAAAWCDPIRYRYSRGIRVVHAGSTRFNSTPRRQHCAPAETATGATGNSGECSRSASRIDAARPSSSENPGSPQPPEPPAPQPDHRTTAPPPAPRCRPRQTPPVRAPGNPRSCRDTRVAHLKVPKSLFVVASRQC